jgi:hypothetical protein
MLKSQVEGAKPLGFVRVNPNELLVIYDSKLFFLFLSNKCHFMYKLLVVISTSTAFPQDYLAT